MAGRRHHFLPQFLLRRFAVKEGQGRGLVWRADLSGNRFITVSPKHEAAKRHYYSLPPETKLPRDFAENAIAHIESKAAAAILKFEREGKLDVDDRHWVALFLALQRNRTPAGREELRTLDEVFAKLDAEVRLSNRDAIRRALSSDGRTPSDDEVTELQKEMFAQLQAGEIVLESTPEREVGLMFTALDRVAPSLVEEFDWRFLVVPGGAGEVVLPDVGVTIFDPTPRIPDGGTGPASSPNSETALYLSPHLVLLLRPGDGSGEKRVASSSDVEKLNLRAVACSDRCIYGPSKELVTAVLQRAVSEPQRIKALRPRPRTMWIAESDGEPTAGVTEFIGHSRDGTVRRQLYVMQEGIEEARRNAYRVPTSD